LTACAVLSVSVATKAAEASTVPGLVPISWALDVASRQTSNVAVAVPWRLEYAVNRLTRAPASVQFFPHISLLGKANAESASLSHNPHFAMGGGICFANAIAFGVGIRVDQPLDHAYIMAGLSLTDLAKLAF
jgi:hypothetical protein